jgi:nitronate monooxygenase
MAGSDNARMVAAASEAGALGSLGGQYRKPDELRAAIREIRSLTDKPFAVNLFALPPLSPPSAAEIEAALQELDSYYSRFGAPKPSVADVQDQISAEDQLNVLLEESIPVFSFTLGTAAKKWMEAFKSKGTVVIGTATNVPEARALEEAGVDAICAQGTEAGGHRGTFIGDYNNSMIGLMSLLPQICDAVSIPVIAAGGIMDGRGIASALALGAQAVQMGTAFLTTTECPVHARYKEALTSHEAHDTTITRVFSGGAARGITNKFMEEQSDSTLLPFPFHNAVTRPLRKVANESGEIDYTNLWSGQSGKLARTLSTHELIETLVKETNEALSKLGAMRL